MKSTWAVLGLVVGLGVVGYVKLRAKADEKRAEKERVALAAPAGERGGAPGADAAPGGVPGGVPGAAAGGSGAERNVAPAPYDPAGSEAQAQTLRRRIDEKRAAADLEGARVLEAELDAKFGDTLEARRHAVGRGIEALRAAEAAAPAVAVGLFDRARRDLTRATLLPEYFDAAGKPTAERGRLLDAIRHANEVVMTAPGGVPGVTTPYVVQRGDVPVTVVSRRKLPYGPNAILYWSHGGNLDFGRLRAGETLLLPDEALSVHVSLSRHLAQVRIGDWLAKEFEVGVGATASPTPLGEYVVGDKQQNPDWHPPAGKVIRFGDPKNELGDVWIEIRSTAHPTGYGIHGTNRPETVGTDCSRGCVRLRNPEATEMFWWVRTARNGEASKVFIAP